MNLPILRFHNIFKSVIWGGERIAQFKGLPSQGDHVGESWELSPMAGNESVVDGGDFDGRTLPSLVEEFPDEILGAPVAARYGSKFPLLIKFIDSNDDLSIQVHPDDSLAAKRHNSLGKTEMWYSIDPAEGAYLYAGFKERITPEQFRASIADNTIVDYLKKFYTKAGDVFFLPAGRVHSIGRGNFVCEIQEASDITYRIYDYDRRDAAGNPRQLHVDESVDAVNYDDTDMEVRNVKPLPDRDVLLEMCPFFTVTLFDAGNKGRFDLAPGRSFTVFVCIGGAATLTDPDGRTTALRQGDTVLIPASIPWVDIAPDGNVNIITAQIIN